MAAFAKRDDLIKWFNEYYRSFGYTDDELIKPGEGINELLESPEVEG